MLRPKPSTVNLDEQTWRVLMQEILVATRKKISSLKNMISSHQDEYICAAIYTFILEEFGKLILLSSSQINNSRREIMYTEEFTNHNRKFEAALDYLEDNEFEDAYILNDQSSFDPKSFSWRSFDIGQLVDLETRLSLLYSDLEEESKTTNIIISKAPSIERKFLEKAVTTFEKVINAYRIPI